MYGSSQFTNKLFKWEGTLELSEELLICHWTCIADVVHSGQIVLLLVTINIS
jgi:hypothetical protein